MNVTSTSQFFENRGSWRRWLEAFHDKEKEIWLIYFKKHSKKKSIVYREALEEALCFGWIDGIVKSLDDERYMQRFTPRRTRSNWSETNIGLAKRLENEGRMHASGLKFREYWILNASPDTKKGIPDVLQLAEFEEALQANRKANENFLQLPPSARKIYNVWIGTAKREETRRKRIAESILYLEKGEKLGLK